MRIAVVGPGHPQKGGVALHTTELARRLDLAGHAVAHVAWKHPYPRLLYPGELELAGPPELATPVTPRRDLTWASPLGWSRVGRAVARGDRAVLVHVTPAQAPALIVIADRCRAAGVPVTVVAHNVEPHESRPGDRALTGLLLRRADRVVVHTESEREAATSLGGHDVRRVALGAALPDAVRDLRGTAPARSSPRLRLVVPGIVRHYKGIDLLIQALADVPDAELLVAGEFWVPPETLRALARASGVDDRVVLRPGYLPAPQLVEMVVGSDVVVLPYRSGTGSQNAELARALGRPVVASRVGGLASDVRDGVDGLLVTPGDVGELARTLRSLSDERLVSRLSAAARTRAGTDTDLTWRRYLEAVAG